MQTYIRNWLLYMKNYKRKGDNYIWNGVPHTGTIAFALVFSLSE